VFAALEEDSQLVALIVDELNEELHVNWTAEVEKSVVENKKIEVVLDMLEAILEHYLA
jgi:hypothetical protein